MSHTKGELKAEPKISDLDNMNPRFSIGIGEEILFTSTLNNALANTHYLLKCWNSHDALLAALKRTLGAMACDELNNGQVFDDELRREVKEAAKAAIAKAEKGKPNEEESQEKTPE